MENKTFELLEKMYTDFSQRFDKIENEIDKLKTIDKKVNKNTLLLEKTNKDIQTIAEVQENHINQNIKQHNEIINRLDSDIDILKTAVSNISKDLKFIEHKEFQNEKAIFNLKDDLKVIK